MAHATALYTASLTTSSVSTFTILTIDCTDVNGISTNWNGAVDVYAVRGPVGSYYGVAHIVGSVGRTTGNVTATNGTPEITGNGLANIALVASGTDLLIRITTNDVNTMYHRVWVVIRADQYA